MGIATVERDEHLRAEGWAMNRAQHWEAVYQTKGDSELSWFQALPGVSLSLIESLRPRPGSVIDIGGGQSVLAGELLNRGFEGVAVLDISSTAIERGKKRLGSLANRVRWIVGDVQDAGDLGPCDVWHDRAVFHFLTSSEDRRMYVAAASRAVRPGGCAIIATFAPTGPEKCSGLPVCRYGPSDLAAEFGDSFHLQSSISETHTTPWGKPQDFTYAVLKRREG